MSFAAIIPVIGSIIDKIIPDKDQKEKAEAQLKLLAQSGELELMLEQIKVNQIEAEHPNLFVAGWRPFIGWICGAIFSYHGIIVHLMSFVAALNGYNLPDYLPEFDITMFTSVLMGLLGLGGLRTYEKYKRVNHRHG
jgi:hypothetical protein